MVDWQCAGSSPQSQIRKTEFGPWLLLCPYVHLLFVCHFSSIINIKHFLSKKRDIDLPSRQQCWESDQKFYFLSRCEDIQSVFTSGFRPRKVVCSSIWQLSFIYEYSEWFFVNIYFPVWAKSLRECILKFWANSWKLLKKRKLLFHIGVNQYIL